jgi:hypothetical protein
MAVRATSGLGMYIWEWDKTGTVDQVVREATRSGISHLVLRASSQSQGFYLKAHLADLLPKAHAAGIKVVAYDPPRFEDVEADVRRAHELIAFRVRGHGIDAFAADIEPRWELLTAANADRYGARLRQVAGPDYPLVGIVFPPSMAGARVPYAQIAKHFDVLSPMSYWRARTLDVQGMVEGSVQDLAAFGKPVSVLGQAFSYDRLRDVSRRGHPPRPEFDLSLTVAKQSGAVGMSFWVWQHAEPWVFESMKAADWPGSAEPGLGSDPPPVRPYRAPARPATAAPAPAAAAAPKPAPATPVPTPVVMPAPVAAAPETLSAQATGSRTPARAAAVAVLLFAASLIAFELLTPGRNQPLPFAGWAQRAVGAADGSSVWHRLVAAAERGAGPIASVRRPNRR